MNEPTQVGSSHDAVGLRAGFSILWGGKWLIATFSLGLAVIVGVASLAVPKSYVGSAVVSPVSGSTAGGALGGLGALASQFGGLASLAGIAVPGDSKKSESLAVLQSEALTEKYIQDNHLLPVLFAKRWDGSRNEWKNSTAGQIPTLWEANEYFKKKIRVVSSDPKSGLATFSITWSDPKVAAKWANDIIRVTNEYLRAKAIQEAEVNIRYLNEQAIKSDVFPIKQGIYSMIQGEINREMIAKGSEEFALKIIDPAVPPDRPVSPRPVSWILFGFFAGLVASMIIVIYRP